MAVNFNLFGSSGLMGVPLLSKSLGDYIKEGDKKKSSHESVTIKELLSIPSVEGTFDTYRDGAYNLQTVEIGGGEVKNLPVWDPVPAQLSTYNDERHGEISYIQILHNSYDRLKGGGDDNNPRYSYFFLQNVSEGRAEKFQVVETFGEWQAYFYGENPRIYTFTGTLIHSKNHKWRDYFLYMYENYWRGTQSAKKRTRTLIHYGGQKVEGYILDVNMGMSADMTTSVPFSMRMLVSKTSTLSGVEAASLDTFYTNRVADTKAKSDISKSNSKSVDHTRGVAGKTIAPKDMKPINIGNPPQKVNKDKFVDPILKNIGYNFIPGSNGSENAYDKVFGGLPGTLEGTQVNRDRPNLGKGRASAYKNAYNGKISRSFELLIKG